MAKLKAQIREDETGLDGLANIKIRLTHKGATRYISTEHYIEPRNFDKRNGRVREIHPLAIDINISLQALELQYQRKLLKLDARIQDIPIKDLLQHITNSNRHGELDFIQIANKRAEYFENNKRMSSAKLLKNTIDKLKKYSGSTILPFPVVTQTFLKGFESWYKMTGSQNSAAIHLRNIRGVFNLAIEENHLSPELYPFRKFKIKTTQTIHRDITPQEIAYLFTAPLTGWNAKARDLWMLSFFLVGVNFKDLIHIERANIRKNRIIYTRAKTKTIYSVKIEPEAQKIIDRYKGKESMLYFIEKKREVQQKKDRNSELYKDITDRTNRALKKIAKAANKKKPETLDPLLSTYYARHSWASIASRLGTNHDVIREALGHSRSVTDTYINFYTQKIDEANRKIIDEILKFCQPGE